MSEGQSQGGQGKAAFENLKLPSMAPVALFRQFGPGLILMMTGIGTSHLVTAPVAGGRYEYALLWCIPVSYIFKYYGFEMAFRFTHATGRSMMDAYATAWKKLPVWYVLITTLIQSAVGQAGRLIAASAVMFYFFRSYIGVDIPGLADDLELAFYGLIMGVTSVAIILGGKYAAVEIVTKIAAGILIVSSFAVYIVEPAPLSSMAYFFSFGAPEGSWLIIASFLGLLPTGIDVSLQASEWGKAKKVGMGRIRDELEKTGMVTRFDAFEHDKSELTVDTSKLPEHVQEYCRRWFRIGIWDFRFGHIISFLIACIFMLLAAVWMYPSEVQGNAVMGEIARIFTDSIGPGMMIVFLAGALAATYSTAFNYFDGWPRLVGACCRN
ncbi:MAG TPA: Nramp family divalent metal transporter, partial [Gammaproteobacteria bacterium]|nr:Nramp family divalent metal transporter [Gammaproteobacteria bacterium]